MSNDNKAEEYRRKAEDCRLLADQSTDPESKTKWLELASRWLVCAEKVETISPYLISAAEQTTPVGEKLSGLKLPPVSLLDAWPLHGALSAAPSSDALH